MHLPLSQQLLRPSSVEVHIPAQDNCFQRGHLQFQVACHYRVFFLFHIVGDGVAVKNSGHGSIDTSADTGLPYPESLLSCFRCCY